MWSHLLVQEIIGTYSHVQKATFWTENTMNSIPKRKCALWTFKPCSHITSGVAFMSNIQDGLYGKTWLCSNLTFAFSRKRQQRSNVNANVHVTCEQKTSRMWAHLWNIYCSGVDVFVMRISGFENIINFSCIVHVTFHKNDKSDVLNTLPSAEHNHPPCYNHVESALLN